MKQELITMLACPLCEGSLEIESASTVFEIAGSQHINDGILTCEQRHRFPVIGEVARLVGAYEEAKRFHEESLALRQTLGHQSGIADSLRGLSNIAVRQGQLGGGMFDTAEHRHPPGSR